ncbi:MAG TPA: kelch repeat-containing protein [Armatimonadota bacterium]|nr:kelch repeat-containing protein [Armatimonadota bacterium]
MSREESPGKRAGLITRREAIGGLVAVVAAPMIVSNVWAQQSGPPTQAPPGAAVDPIPRVQHTATTLQDGRVLVAGGFYLGALSSVQIYDPVSNTWTNAASLNVPRSEHAAALLTDGTVLVSGGFNLSPLSHAEIYDPVAGNWTATGSMNVARYQHTAALVSGAGRDVSQVMVTGGLSGSPLIAVEFYDNGVWTLA